MWCIFQKHIWNIAFMRICEPSTFVTAYLALPSHIIFIIRTLQSR